MTGDRVVACAVGSPIELLLNTKITCKKKTGEQS